MLPLQRPPRWLRDRLLARSGGFCERAECQHRITLETMHVAHLRSRASGGPLIEENAEAWCVPCNLRNGPRDISDTRKLPREWQLEAQAVIVQQLLRSSVATLSAAPGAGKTVFAALVFERLFELDMVDRMVVFVPRITLVEQWVAALAADRHLELRPNSAYERPHSAQVGVVTTYQSLPNLEVRQNHHEQMAASRTLLVLDEVHHVGEPSSVGMGYQIPAWSQFVTELAGTVDRDLRVASVLNLSGTLWRSSRSERISTIRYEELPDGRLQSLVDWDVPAEDLIAKGELRPVDLFRLGAHVEIHDYASAQVIESHITDLDAKPARAALGDLGNKDVWRKAFVGAVLDRLEAAYRSLEKHHVKALIVASSQEQARAMRETADALMVQRGLRPIAKLAVSDEKQAVATLEEFRRAEKPGVLCTVDMAGEGYDCPDIAVIGFASNKLTPLYVRQVVARAQRVTDRERRQGRPIPATVVLPDAPELVALMVSILKPMHHEIVRLPESPKGPPGGGGDGGGGPGPRPRVFTLHEVNTVDDHPIVNVTGEDMELDGQLVAGVEQQFTAVNLRPSDAPRAIVAFTRLMEERRTERPFDGLTTVEASIETVTNASRYQRDESTPKTRPLTDEERAKRLRRQLGHAAGWWHQYGNSSAEEFNAGMNRTVGWFRGGRDNASLDQLELALKYAVTRIQHHCLDHNLRPPNWDRCKSPKD